MVSELTLAVSKVMFSKLRPASITVGEFAAFWLNMAVFVLVVPVVAPGTAPLQFPVAAQLVLLAPVQPLSGTTSPVCPEKFSGLLTTVAPVVNTLAIVPSVGNAV